MPMKSGLQPIAGRVMTELHLGAMLGSLRVLVLYLAVALAAAAAGRSDAQAPPPGKAAPPAFRAVPITVARAEAREVQRSVETVGSLLPWQETQVKTEQPGTIAKLHADLGDSVPRGKVLAEYDTREFELAVAQADADLLSARQSLQRSKAAVEASEAALRRAKDNLVALQAEVARTKSQVDWGQSELQRNQELYRRELIAARDVDNMRNQLNIAAAQAATARTMASQYPDQVRAAEAQHASDLAAVRAAEAQVKQREAALGLTQKRLGDATVRAPLAGLVDRRHVNPGEYVKDNTPLFTIVVAHPLKYVGTVPERQAPDLRIGQVLRPGAASTVRWSTPTSGCSAGASATGGSW